MKPARTQTYEHTISGLLKKRTDLFNEAERIRDRLAEIGNDMKAMDHVLGSFGYAGNIDSEMPRYVRNALFRPGELTRAILGELRAAQEPLASRDIARAIIVARGQDPGDRKLLTQHTRRVAKALRVLKERGLIHGAKDQAGNMVWERGT